MPEFRKKPVVIEAIQYQPHENCGEVGRFMGLNDGDDYECDESENDEYAIETLEGVMWAQPGDWIIRGVQGEFYPCKPDIFEQTYVVAEPPLVDHVQLFTDAAGQHRWRAVARNGEPVASGEGYRNASDCRGIVEAMFPGIEIREAPMPNPSLDIPTPGSDEALELGCRCPIIDNAHGRGAMGTSGDDAEFWTNAACPLHGSTISDPKDTPITIHGLVSQVECDVIDVTTAGREHRYVGGANTVTFATSYGRLTVPWPTHATPQVGAELTLTISEPNQESL